MGIGIDTSKWKPRKLKGTPALKIANYIGVGIISFGIICGTILQCGSFLDETRKKFEKYYEDPIEEVERKLMIASHLPNKSAYKLRWYLAEERKLDKPDT